MLFIFILLIVLIIITRKLGWSDNWMFIVTIIALIFSTYYGLKLNLPDRPWMALIIVLIFIATIINIWVQYKKNK